MEGYRFFDLVRWGIAADYLNTYFSVEKTKRQYLQTARFTAGRDEYLPIPLNQINFSKGLYKQNPAGSPAQSTQLLPRPRGSGGIICPGSRRKEPPAR